MVILCSNMHALDTFEVSRQVVPEAGGGLRDHRLSVEVWLCYCEEEMCRDLQSSCFRDGAVYL